MFNRCFNLITAKFLSENRFLNRPKFCIFFFFLKLNKWSYYV